MAATRKELEARETLLMRIRQVAFESDDAEELFTLASCFELVTRNNPRPDEKLNQLSHRVHA